MRLRLLTVAAAAAFLALPGIAEAQNAMATADVNMRVGPGTQHPVIATLPAGAPVTVRGCVRGYSWCDTSYRGTRGWVSGRYLAGAEPRYRGRALADIGPQLGIGIIAGAVFSELLRDRRDWRRAGPPPRRWTERHAGPRWQDRRGAPRWQDRRGARQWQRGGGQWQGGGGQWQSPGPGTGR